MRLSKTNLSPRAILFLTGLLPVFGSADAQAPANLPAASPATNSDPAAIAPPASASVSVTNRPAQVAQSDDSIDSLRQKAEAGDAIAQCNFGDCYYEGTRIKKDLCEAAKWYRRSADQGNADAQCNLGVSYYNGEGVQQDMAEALKWFSKAADQGDAEAQCDLGNCYHEGVGVKKDLVEAVKWWRKAADQGLAMAQAKLGWCYHNGDGVQKDSVEAVKWWRKAADQGDALSQCMVGDAYNYGEGVHSDIFEAEKWLRKAIAQGNKFAASEIELPVVMKKEKMLDDERQGAAKGDPNAEAMLGFDYAYGGFVPQDSSQGLKWLLKAANQGNILAEEQLGLAYEQGTWLPKDYVESAKWIGKAASSGSREDQGVLGEMYWNGQGVPKDQVEGLAWFYVASASGDENAVKECRMMESVLGPSTSLLAQQRGKEIAQSIEAAKQHQNALAKNVPGSDEPKASGSGAFISADGLVLTAAHVVQGASRIEVVTGGGKLAATVVKIDATNDVAILKCTGGSFTPLAISPSKEARAGTAVFTIGFPNIQVQGFDPKLTSGEISSLTGFQDDPRQWQISVPIQPGNSGGPLCDESGNLIGIVEATLNPLTMAKIAGEIPQNVNYAVKSSYILPLLDDVQNLPLSTASPNGAKIEDVVGRVQKSVVLVLVY